MWVTHRPSRVQISEPCAPLASPCGHYSKATSFNTLRPRQYGRHFPDDIFKRICLNENVSISLKISLKFVPNVQFTKFSSIAADNGLVPTDGG